MANKITLIRCNSDLECVLTEVPNNKISVPVSTPSSTQFRFSRKPSHVLIVKQWKNPATSAALKEIADWLKTEHKVLVHVEPSVKDEFPELIPVDPSCPGRDIDFVVVLGGDGTVLHLNSLFQGEHSIPPVFPLAMGSLGFLAPYKLSNYRTHLNRILNSHIEPLNMTLRTRLMCQVYRAHTKDSFMTYQALNEALVYRGLEPSLTKLDFFVDNSLATVIQADGVIIGSPTGSTAYSLSAGGSILPPTAPVFLITPICPHSLSFRPLILPDCSKLKIRIHQESRAACLVSFDGRNQVSMDKGDYVTISMSPWPLPTISMVSPSVEWFRSINSRLNWNVREIQKGLNSDQVNIRHSIDEAKDEKSDDLLKETDE